MSIQQEIAKRLEVSTSTVSRALKDNPRISQELKNEIFRLADEMGYTEKSHLKKLKVTPVVHVFIQQEEGTNKLEDLLLRHVVDAAKESRMNFSVYKYRNAASLELQYKRFLQNYSTQKTKLQGAMILKSMSEDYAIKIAKALPTISINHRLKDESITTVRGSEEYDVEYMLNQLWDNGHREIAFVASDTLHPLGNSRFAGYLNFLKNKKSPFQDDKVINVMRKELTGDSLAKALLVQIKQQGITAMAFTTGIQAFRFLSELKNDSMLLPDKFSIVAYDHLNENDEYNLSGIQPDYALIMESAFEILNVRFNRKSLKFHNVSVPGEFMLGETVHSLKS